MDQRTFHFLNDYMLTCMTDSAHDREHIYRVLYNALDIAQTEEKVDYDILICACLLHDIGRREQFEDPSLCHAEVGGLKAYRFLIEHSFSEDFASKVRDCIQSHRFRKNASPQTIEAKILFDADKIDVSGATGIARTLIYKGQVSEPLYSLLPDGRVSNGEGDRQPSFFHEYKYKLEKLYSHFYTKRGREIAMQRQAAAQAFYNSIFHEVSAAYDQGAKRLERLLHT